MPSGAGRSCAKRRCRLLVPRARMWRLSVKVGQLASRPGLVGAGGDAEDALAYV